MTGRFEKKLKLFWILNICVILSYFTDFIRFFMNLVVVLFFMKFI